MAHEQPADWTWRRLAPHRAGGPLRLGGIDVPHDRQLVGHSDADVLLHAVTDALLGAAALPDIGQLFPNTDAANRGRDSAEMLRRAADKVAEAGYRVVNLDCVVHAERPKLADYKDAIRHRIAGILGLEPASNRPQSKNRRRRRPRRPRGSHRSPLRRAVGSTPASRRHRSWVVYATHTRNPQSELRNPTIQSDHDASP